MNDNSTLSHTRTHAKWKFVVPSIHSCNRIEIDYTVSTRVASIYRFLIEMAFKLTAKRKRPNKQTQKKITQYPKPIVMVHRRVVVVVVFFFGRSNYGLGECEKNYVNWENAYGQLDARRTCV